MAPRRQRITLAALGILGAMLGIFSPAGAPKLWAQVGDRRLPAADKAVPAPLASAARSVAFVDVVSTEPGALPDGGTAILVSDCLALTANHVFEALAPGREAVTLRLRFPALTDGNGRPKSFAAKLETRPSGLRRDPVSDDWALLRLTETPELSPLEIAPAKCCDWQSLPAPAAVAGFPADKFNAETPSLWIDPACSIERRLAIPVLATNCQATSGNSGGPVLVQSGGSWKLAAMLTRAPPPRRQGLSGGQTSYALVVDGRIARAITRAKKLPCSADAPRRLTKLSE